jgi:hypothetical protein
LSLGQPIQVGVVPHVGRGVDTFEDYQRFVADYSVEPAIAARAA